MDPGLGHVQRRDPGLRVSHAYVTPTSAGKQRSRDRFCVFKSLVLSVCPFLTLSLTPLLVVLWLPCEFDGRVAIVCVALLYLCCVTDCPRVTRT